MGKCLNGVKLGEMSVMCNGDHYLCHQESKSCSSQW